MKNKAAAGASALDFTLFYGIPPSRLRRAASLQAREAKERNFRGKLTFKTEVLRVNFNRKTDKTEKAVSPH